MELQNVKKLAEFMTSTSFEERVYIKKGINAYLQSGWTLLAIHERGHHGEYTSMHTVYVFGSDDPDANEPYYNQQTRLWEIP